MNRKLSTARITYWVIVSLTISLGAANSVHAFGKKSSKPSEAVSSSGPKSSNSSSSSTSSSSVGESVWVVRSDGAKSCSPGSGQDLDAGKKELTSAGVQIIEARKGNDGKMYMQMCGAPTGTVNAYRISKTDLPKAAALGFKESPSN